MRALLTTFNFNRASLNTAALPAAEKILLALLCGLSAYITVSGLTWPQNAESTLQFVGTASIFTSTLLLRHYLNLGKCDYFLRYVLFASMISFLYVALGELAFSHMPWQSDNLLFAIEKGLQLESLHTEYAPTLTSHRWITEVLAFGYCAFIPYLQLSLLYNGMQSDSRLRELFLTAIAIMYSIGFFGYLFAPASGPIVLLQDLNLVPVEGGFFYQVVTNSIDQAGGPHGAFPSIHMSAAFMMCLFDFKYGKRKRAFLYIPIVVLIALATVLLRYHYVIDLIAGAALAVFSLAIATAWIKPHNSHIGREK